MTIHLQGKHKSGFTVDVAEPFTFPAGEAHIKGLDILKIEDYEYFLVDIRGHSPQDLFHLALFADGITELSKVLQGIDDIPELYVLLPYLPAARADRGVPFGAQVYADFISSTYPDYIIGLDPHSPVMPKMLSQYQEFPFERIIKDKIAHASGDEFQMDHNYAGVIAPDKGAHDRAKRAADVLHVPVFTAGKTRDFETGQLTGFHMEDELPKDGKFLIVDDICDGGGTFIGLAEAIKKTNPNVTLDLWVTHGIFSKGPALLMDHFDTVHTTNSYYQPGNSEEYSGMLEKGGRLVVHDITAYLYFEVSRLHAEGLADA